MLLAEKGSSSALSFCESVIGLHVAARLLFNPSRMGVASSGFWDRAIARRLAVNRTVSYFSAGAPASSMNQQRVRGLVGEAF